MRNAIWSARPRRRVDSGPESSRGGCGRIARLPTRLGPSPENTTSRSGCSASERVAPVSARLKISPGLSFWDIAKDVSARVPGLEGKRPDPRDLACQPGHDLV